MEPDSFISLKNYLDGINDQKMGDPCVVCETGETYKEFSEKRLCRPADIEIAESECAAAMRKRLDNYFSERQGRLYWRIPFEYERAPTAVVIRFDIDGPDLDFLTNRKCVTDKNWIQVQCYCRLYKSTFTGLGVSYSKSKEAA